MRRTSAPAAAAAPIRSHSTRGFFLGWVLVLSVGVAMFAVATMNLGHSSSDARFAQLSGLATAGIPQR